MRLFRFGTAGTEKPGVVDGEGRGRDISALVPDLAGEWLSPGRLKNALAGVDLTKLPHVDWSVRLGPCVGQTGNFLAIGLNYTDHAAESGMDLPAEPIVFNKAPSCVVGPNDDIELPPGSKKTDWEVELAVIIGAKAYRVAEPDVDAVIAGYCVCNDVSEREYQLERGGGQWTKGKGCPTFGPLGPYLVTPDEIEDVQNLGLWLDLNGVRLQSGSTKLMAFSVRHLVSYVSQFMILSPGDVITTGTPPGVGFGMKPPVYLKGGDVVELGIDGLGVQRQRVRAT